MVGRVLSLLALVAVPVAAEPMDLFWRADASGLAASGSFAPPPVLGGVRPEYPTSMAWTAGEAAVELRAAAPLTLRRGRREFGEITAYTREARLALPVGNRDERANWHLGCSVGGSSTQVNHRLRRDTTALSADATTAHVSLAWSDDRWAIGVSHADCDLSGDLSGTTIADLQAVRRGDEGISLTGDCPLNTIAAEYLAYDWRVGAQLADGEYRLDLPAAVDGEQYHGVFANTERRLDAWAVAQEGDRRWFAWYADADADPRPSAIFAGEALRGRISVDGNSTAWGIGLRREGARVSTHFELSHHDDALDLSGYVNRGALGGGLTGQYTASATARLQTLAVRWAEERRSGPWRLRYGASSLRSEMDFAGRFVDAPGPLTPPLVRWDQHLEDGEAWLFSVSAGAGYESKDWRLDTTFTALGGNFAGVLQDLTAPDPPTSPHPPPTEPPPSPEPSGPGMRLDLGWLAAFSITRAL